MVVTTTVKRQVILPSFVHNFQTNKAKNVIKASGAQIGGSVTKIEASGVKIGTTKARIGGFGANIRASWGKIGGCRVKIGG